MIIFFSDFDPNQIFQTFFGGGGAGSGGFPFQSQSGGSSKLPLKTQLYEMAGIEGREKTPTEKSRL